MKKLLLITVALITLTTTGYMALHANNVPVNLQSGTQTFGPANVNNSITRIQARLKRMTDATPTFWNNPATIIEIKVEASTDGGANYFLCCGATFAGGIADTRDGTQIPESTLDCPLPAPTGQQRRVRAQVTVNNGPLVSQFSLETF